MTNLHSAEKNTTFNERTVSGKSVFYPFFASLSIFLFIEFFELISPFSSLGSAQEYYLIFTIYYSGLLLTLTPFVNVRFYVPSLYESSYLARKIIKVTLLLSAIGILMVLFDRTLIQGVDYSEGFSSARTSWQESASVRQGVSSPISVLGNLFYPLLFIAVILTVVYFEHLRKARLYLTIAFLECISFSFIIGGKTEVLIFTATIISAISMRPMLKLSLVPLKLRRLFLIIFILLIAVVILVFSSRMGSSSVGFYSYLESLVYRHSGKIINSLSQDESDIYYAFLGAIVYFVHVKWIFIEALNSYNQLYGNAFFNQFFSILSSRAGFNLTALGYDVNWTFSGRWISFLGSYWHDFRYLGLYIFFPIFFMVYFALNRWMLGCGKIKGNRKFISLVVLYALFNAFFIFSAFSSLFSVVSYIYLVFSSVFFIFLYVFLYAASHAIKR